MGQFEYEALKPIGALLKATRAIAVTGTSANVDLTTLAEFKGVAVPPVAAYDNTDRIFRLRADGNDVYFGFYIDGSLTIDDTNTTAGNAAQCDLLPNGQFIDICIPWTRRLTATGNGQLASFLYFKCSGANTAKLRVTLVSEAPNVRYG